jgi:hypothetical protein
MSSQNTCYPLEAFQARVVFCLWTGANPMSTNRIQALFSIFNNLSCPIAYLTQSTIPNWEVPGHPFHPSFAYLSETHKSDYLRVYLMHHYGGGYTDIKHTTQAWPRHFDSLVQSDMLCAGYTELSPRAVAKVGGALEQALMDNYQSLIGLCAFIFKPHTPLTREWLKRTHDLLDRKMTDLVKHPARFPQDQYGVLMPDGQVSQYPLQWTEMLGNIFHPLILEYKQFVLHLPMSPEFHSYR